VTHPEYDQLISLALGEPDDDASAHLAGCAACRADLATLRQVATVGAETQSVRDLPAPPVHVWNGIEAALTAAPAPVDLTAERARRGEPAERRGRARGAGSRWPTWATAAAASVAAVAVAVAVTLAVAWPRDPGTPDRIVASAVLTAFGETPASAHGDAEVLADGQMRVRFSDLPPVDGGGYYQVWLIDPATLQMFPLGVLGQGSSAQLPLPSDVDLAQYSLVDVSAEHFDNNPAHSGDSLLRGELT
jgi:anti-sigma-K factor RskA